jgi:hypothetical protein
VQANEQIVKCRRILKWTYAYGYYKFDTLSLPDRPSDGVSEADVAAANVEKADIEAKKALFEFLQNDAESSLEVLSNAVEQRMKRFYHEEEFWRLTTKADPQHKRRVKARPHGPLSSRTMQCGSRRSVRLQTHAPARLATAPCIKSAPCRLPFAKLVGPDSDRPSRRVQGMDDHEFISAEFLELQKDVLNLTQVSRKFFDKLVEQLEQGLDGLAERYGAAAAAAAPA